MPRNPLDTIAAIPRAITALPRIATTLPRIVPDLSTRPQGRIIEMADGVTTRLYDTAEPDLPTVVLLHGMGATGILNWYQTFQRLSGEFRLITYDQRWHGQGYRGGEFSFADLRDDLFRLTDHLHLEKPVVAGYSMGGIVSQLAARRDSSRFAGLVLAATGTGGERNALERTLNGQLLRVATQAAPAALAHEVPPHESPTADDPDENVYRWALRELSSVSPRTSRQVLTEVARFNSTSWLHELDLPVAVIKTLHDLAFPQRIQDELADLLPHSAVFPIDGGHAACATHPGDFARRVRTGVNWVLSNQGPLRK